MKKKKVWSVNIKVDGEDDVYAECDSWVEAFIAVFTYVEKDSAFDCSIDFFYRDGDRE